MSTMIRSQPPGHRNTKAVDLRRMSMDEVYDLAERLEGRPVPGVRMSETEFVAWCGHEVRAEWVDGEVILMAPVSDEHDELTIWLIRLVGEYVEEHELGALRQNIFVRLSGPRSRRVPDMLYVSSNRSSILKPTYCDGAPDLIIEIVSSDSQSRDRREKYQEYEKAGVREYWIVDPLSRSAEVYKLVGKKFQLIEERDGIVASSVLGGFRLKTDFLWRKPLPKVAGVLKQMRAKS